MRIARQSEFNKVAGDENIKLFGLFDDRALHAALRQQASRPVHFIRIAEGADAHAMHDAFIGDGDFLDAGFEAGKGELGLEVVGIGGLLERTHLEKKDGRGRRLGLDGGGGGSARRRHNPCWRSPWRSGAGSNRARRGRLLALKKVVELKAPGGFVAGLAGQRDGPGRAL